jgi:DNA-binding Lrp family transcriptional regulator
MLYKAYVLIKVIPHREDKIIREISKVPAIVEVHKLFGQFDVIAEVEREGMREIMESIYQIRAIEGVLDTVTNLVADFEMDVHGGPI